MYCFVVALLYFGCYSIDLKKDTLIYMRTVFQIFYGLILFKILVVILKKNIIIFI